MRIRLGIIYRLFCFGLLVCSFMKLGFPSAINAADEQTVIINIRLNSGEMGSPEERERIVKLEHQLAAAVKESGTGDFDGDEFGNGFCTVYMYGPNADRLFNAVQPVLKKSRVPSGSSLIKRYGKPGAKQVRVAIGADDGQQPK